jgi:hypothetical protein
VSQRPVGPILPTSIVLQARCRIHELEIFRGESLVLDPAETSSYDIVRPGKIGRFGHIMRCWNNQQLQLILTDPAASSLTEDELRERLERLAMPDDPRLRHHHH